ncbi:recombinase RecA [Urbifossiella limnaea]|uniref:Protein RecA n=1 Tax=Urbifossiella limnaea TaxID=2528023 RepID=A0A517XZL6_9BACT|nr:recombinase RecA [Urbifossiella limnaea]QDU22949.1 Protein RecA [Urbifossiella limnaea]
MAKELKDAKENKELKTALSAIEKEFGKGAIMSLGDMNVDDVEGISTGCLGLDIALGGKGLPRGRVVEIYGAEASGKTTVALHAVANVQKNGGVAAFIDAEHALDPSWAKRIGVDLDSLLVSQPGYGEEGLRIAEMLIKSNAVDLIVVDSVAALVPKNEIQDSEIGDTKVGLQARLMSQAMRILTPTINKSRTCLLFINQIRQKIGVMYGDPNTTTGGLALKFYASVRMEVKRITHVKDGDETIGAETRVRVVKNKIAPPFRNAEFEILHDRGIDYEGDLLKLALEDEIIEKSGAFFSYKEQRLGQGKDKAVTFLRENPAVRAELTAAVLEKRKPKPSSQELMDAAAAAAKDEAEAAAELATIGEAPEAEAPKKRRGKAAE